MFPCKFVIPVTLFLLGIGGPALGGLIRHDKSDSLYTDLALQPQFASTGQLMFGGLGRASATLIGSADNQWLLTAAHNFVIPNEFGSPLPTEVRFRGQDGNVISAGLDANSLRFTDGTSNIGGFDSLSTAPDLALIRLSNSIDVPTARLYDANVHGSELGRTVTYAGYGITGDGLDGPNDSQDDPDNPMSLRLRLRAGENVIDAVQTQDDYFARNLPEANPDSELDYLWTDFDHPGDSSWNLPDTRYSSSSDALDLEYSVASGDSGGSMYTMVGDEWYLAGVISGGLDPFIDGLEEIEIDGEIIQVPTSTQRDATGVTNYGFLASSARVSSNMSWIQSTIAVPEPSTFAFLGSGAFVWFSRRRRRRNQDNE